jgi:hypothetical protein
MLSNIIEMARCTLFSSARYDKPKSRQVIRRAKKQRVSISKPLD